MEDVSAVDNHILFSNKHKDKNTDRNRNVLFENEEDILRDVYAKRNDFQKSNARYKQQILIRRRERVEAEQREKELLENDAEIRIHRKYRRFREKSDWKRNEQQRLVKEEDNCNREKIPALLPPIYRQTYNELRKVDFSCELFTNTSHDDICMIRYLRLPQRYHPKI
jgi:hypothetical protein